jgi:hypothetical protein
MKNFKTHRKPGKGGNLPYKLLFQILFFQLVITTFFCSSSNDSSSDRISIVPSSPYDISLTVEFAKISLN